MTPEHCATCADEAVVARVVELDGVDAVVERPDGSQERVALDLVSAAQAGERLLCHAGIALARVEEGS